MRQAISEKISHFANSVSQNATIKTSVKTEDISRGYLRQSSITRYLPWRDYIPVANQF